MSDMPVVLAGCSISLDPAGAIWMASIRTLIVADLHLEKGSSYARRQVFLPPYDTDATLAALSLLITRRDPACVVCLGDSFHDPDAADRLTPGARALIHQMQQGREWIWVSGNHDPQTPKYLGGDRADALRIGELSFRHEPCCSANGHIGEVAGHLHPSARIRQRGRSVRRRAFVTDGQRLVMPAFGALTGGLNVLDPAFSGLFSAKPVRAFMMASERLFAIAPAALRPG
jgi:DNA ligase-associated metallophosphoesterase